MESELSDLKRRGWAVLVTTLEAAELGEFELQGLKDACRDMGIEWVHFGIADRGVPSVEAMIGLAARLHREVGDGAGVAVHCRQGIGRSSLVVASVLVAGGATPEHAWEQVAAARGRPVPDTPEQRTWLSALAASAR